MIEFSQFHDDFEVSSLIEATRRALKVVSTEAHANTLRALLLTLETCSTRAELSRFIKERFFIQQVQESHVTGYYQPVVDGSLERSERFSYPLYAIPEGQLPDRAAIDSAGALSGRGLEIAWLSDPVERYFLHIQGSGKLKLPDSTTREILFAGHNSRTYFAIGTELVKKGAILPGNVSMQSIKDYLRKHPDEMQTVMNLNPRYIFFKLAAEGPVGTSGALLTPMRSIATDWGIYPPGALCHLQIPLPQFDQKGNATGTKNSSFFTFNQDTGGAIIGAGRVDLYTGEGERAGQVAGVLNCRGTLTVLAAARQI